MLTSLLPGLRELRAPLAAGALWLTFAALMLAPSAEELKAGNSAASTVAALYEALPEVLQLGALAFAAFLVGTISVTFFPSFFDLGTWRFGAIPVVPRLTETSLGLWIGLNLDITFVGRDLLDRTATRVLSQLPETPYRKAPAATTAMRNALRMAIVQEFDLARTRLALDLPEVFGQVDRMRAESELRISVCPPMLALSYWASQLNIVVTGLCFVATYVTLVGGLRLRRRGGDRLSDALYQDRVQVPVLEEVKKAITDLPDPGLAWVHLNDYATRTGNSGARTLYEILGNCLDAPLRHAPTEHASPDPSAPPA